MSQKKERQSPYPMISVDEALATIFAQIGDTTTTPVKVSSFAQPLLPLRIITITGMIGQQ